MEDTVHENVPLFHERGALSWQPVYCLIVVQTHQLWSTKLSNIPDAPLP